MDKNNVVSSVFLILTENCNLRCVYCFEGGSRCVKNYMSKETAFKTIDFLFKNVEEYNSLLKENDERLKVKVTFFGGEPTLCPDLMIEILRYAKEKQDKIGVEFKPNIITNGTIFNEKIKEFLDVWIKLFGKNSIDIQLSIDGSPEIQNENRPCANNSLKSSELVERTVECYRNYFFENGISLKNLYIHSCISHKNIGKIYETYLYFLNVLKIKKINFAWVMESDWEENDLSIFSEQLRKINTIACKIGENLKDYPFKHFNTCKGCGCGKRLISVDTNGDIYPCHRFFFYKKENTKIGNIYNENPICAEKRQVYENFNAENLGNFPCQVCIAVNYQYSGDINKLPSDWNTKFNEIINYYYEIYNEVIEKKTIMKMFKKQNERITALEEKVRILESEKETIREEE